MTDLSVSPPLDLLKAVLLGAVQGVTEFLPISSSAHLAVTQRLLHLAPDSPSMLLFDVLTHVGTLLAVMIVFGRQFTRFAGRLVREMQAEWPHPRTGWRIALLAAAASVPTAGIGLGFQSTFETAFDRPGWIGASLILTATMLALTTFLSPRRLRARSPAPLPTRPSAQGEPDVARVPVACPSGPQRVGGPRRGWRQFGFFAALLVGVAQGASIMPGISRSGATICTALFLGLRARWAAQFSFLIAVPAILGATGVKALDTWRLPADELAAMPWAALYLGAVTSLIVGVFALLVLLRVVHRAKLHWFAPYCAVLGAALLLKLI